MGAELTHTDGRTDEYDEAKRCFFGDYAKAPKMRLKREGKYGGNTLITPALTVGQSKLT